MPEPLVTPHVLRRMVIERIEAAHRGEFTREYMRGYLNAMFHAGAITMGECQQLLGGEGEPFELTPDGQGDDPPVPLRP